MANWTIEVRVDSLKGKTLGSTDKMIQVAGKNRLKVETSPTSDYHDIYLVFVRKTEDKEDGDALKIRSVTFLQKKKLEIK